ncbi:hypothetical protein JOC36_000934 [Weissella uvarum]|uniref:hypothetical protein n=1 Tax=Weissella uvarum TaxID=1479233 RepID=UPI00195F4B52|nr:hypothetical protein [Weissella uvarum]MBM7617377.1 hypothetical protein [Weissella uvarum]MCM0595736.1 hypothetical protein [Weissella uvarum]
MKIYRLIGKDTKLIYASAQSKNMLFRLINQKYPSTLDEPIYPEALLLQIIQT